MPLDDEEKTVEPTESTETTPSTESTVPETTENEKKPRGPGRTNKTPPSSTNPNTMFKKGRITREEFIKLCREERKARNEKWRLEQGIPKKEPSFNLNNEKIWFRNTYRQTKVHLVNKFVRMLKKYRFMRDKLNQTDVKELSDERQKSIKKKIQRCTNGEETILKEMYLIKSWKANQVFDMLLKTEPISFDNASQIAHDTGNLNVRAIERIREYKLVLPVWERLNKELKLFNTSNTSEGESRATKLAKDVLEDVEKEKRTGANPKTSTKPEKAKTESEEDSTGEESSEDREKTDDLLADNSRFNFAKLGDLMTKAEDKTSLQKEESEEESDEEATDAFKEYSSEEESEDDEVDENVRAALKADEPFEIEFTLPKSFQKATETKLTAVSEKKVSDDEDEDKDTSSESEYESENEADESNDDEKTASVATNGFFMTVDHKPVKVAKTTNKKEVKKFAKDNRDGQRERKRYAKAVYGKDFEEMEKQALLKKKLSEKKERKAEKRKMKEEKRNQPVDMHPSWQASKKAKEQTVIQEFKGTKITFDDSD